MEMISDSSPDDVGSNHARVAVSAGPLVAPVLNRVVGMLAARAQCPLDRLDEALAVTDALAAHGPDQQLDGRLTLEVTARTSALELRVGPLVAGGARAVLSAADLPGVGSVVERMADRVWVEPADDGAELLVVCLRFSEPAPPGG